MPEQLKMTFEPKELPKAMEDLLHLTPNVLQRNAELMKSFNSMNDDAIDEKIARELISELTFCYVLIPVTIKKGHTIFRGRKVKSGALLSEVTELGPIPKERATIQRANAHGESIFYGGSSQETVVAELQLTVGQAVNVGAFWVKPETEITAHVLGEMDYLRRWNRTRFLPVGLEIHIQNMLKSIHPDVALAIQLVDAFLADRFSRVGPAAYRVTNMIANEFLQSQTIDAIVYTSVAHAGGFNYAIKPTVTDQKLELHCCLAEDVIEDYGYGSYRAKPYGFARLGSGDTKINWITPNHPSEVIQEFKLRMQKDADVFSEWMRMKPKAS